MSVNARKLNQAGHFHLIVLLIVVIAIVVGTGWLVYNRSHQASDVTNNATRAKIKQASADLKSVDLSPVQKTVQGVSGVQNSANFKKANGE